MYTKEKIEEAVKAKGYVWFEDKSNKNFDVNIVGIRNSTTNTKVTNIFDDLLTITYKENGEWKTKTWAITTDPGKKAMINYHNPKGVARLVPGQYRSMHSIAKHQGKYDALCQRKPCTVFRDADKNFVYDESKTDTGIFGINIHHAGENSTVVENWSEGCQVFKRIKDFNEFMAICEKAKTIHGNSFTYTLLTSNDLL